MTDDLNVTIRPLQAPDLECVERLLPFGVPGKHRARLTRQQAGELVYLIAWKDASPVGHAVLKLTRPPDDPRSALLSRCPEIEDLLVHPAWRSRGVGGQLLAALEQAAKERGYSQVGLSVAIDNGAARRLYARSGYTDAGFGRFSLGGSFVDAEGQLQTWAETCLYLTKQLD